MRAELERIKKIEDYLLNNLSDSEKNEFEQEINQNEDLTNEIEAQKLLIERVKTISLKKRISAAHKRYLKTNNNFFNGKGFIGGTIIITIIIIALFFNHIIHNKVADEFNVEKPFINPPLASVDVPIKTYSLNASEQNIITYESGTKIIIPINAFLDTDGNIVTDEVELHYREFNDPIDFYLAGIPMNINLDGQNYTMESAAMCEINATSNGKQLQVNPNNPISIFQSSYTSSTAFDLYYLDTVAKTWTKRGKDVPINTNDFTFAKEHETNDRFSEQIITKPIKPKKANPERYSFSITIDLKEFPEMEGFKNITFEIDENEKRYNPSDGDVLWEDIHIQKGTKQGTYQITFLKNTVKRSVQYIARPVFEGASYSSAMKLYNKKIAEYKKKKTKNNQLEASQKAFIKRRNYHIDSINAEIEKRTQTILVENQHIDSVNKITQKKNKIILRQALIVELDYKRVTMQQHKVLSLKQAAEFLNINKENLPLFESAINHAYAKHSEYIDLSDKIEILISSDLITSNEKAALKSLNRNQLLIKKDEIKERFKRFKATRNTVNSVSREIIRQFEIDGFGFWNCDIITKLGNTKIKAEFYDLYAKMNVNDVVYVNSQRNSLFRVRRENFPKFRYDSGQKAIVWLITNDKRLAYYNDFENLSNKTDFTFNLETLEASEETFTGYEQIRAKLIELMK